MNNVSIPVALMGSVCVYVGLYHLWMFIRRKTEKDNLLFALASLTIAVYDFACAGLYNASSVAEGMFWQRYQFASLALFSISLGWFVYYFTDLKKKKILGLYSIAMFTFFILVFIVRNELTLSLNNPMIKNVVIGNLLSLTYNEVDPGLILILQYVTMMAGFVYILVVVIKYYRNVSRKQVRPLLLSLIFFFIAAVNDVLVGAAVYPFIYVLEYVYLIIILSMAFMLLNKFVNLHFEVEDLNRNLEDKVAKRTAELQKAMSEMELMNKELEQTRDSLWGEMQLAKKIQSILVPAKPEISGFDISVYMKPADEVGGDYYDIINVGGLDWIVIGDVSGHGVPAGLIMMMVQTSIHTALDSNPNFPPSKLLTLINKTIVGNIKLLGEDKYMTITVLAAYEDGVFNFSGLHQDIFIYRSVSNHVDVVETEGVWIGLLDDIHGMVNDSELTINIGDTMLVYTDGITESRLIESESCPGGKTDDMFGDEKLQDILCKLGNKSAREIQHGILQELDAYENNDDITMVVLKRLK